MLVVLAEDGDQRPKLALLAELLEASGRFTIVGSTATAGEVARQAVFPESPFRCRWPLGEMQHQQGELELWIGARGLRGDDGAKGRVLEIDLGIPLGLAAFDLAL